MRRSVARVALPAVLTVLLAVSACGGDDPEETGTTGDSSATADAGSGDEPGAEPGSDAGSSPVNFADCSAISADEMGAVLGEGTGTSEVPPASTSCTYALDDPRQPSVSVEQFTTADFADGWDGAKANVAGTPVGPIEGTPTEVSGVGDGAIVVVGPSVGGTSLQSIGLVLIGDTIVRASVLQAIELDEAGMTELTTGILALVASKA